MTVKPLGILKMLLDIHKMLLVTPNDAITTMGILMPEFSDNEIDFRIMMPMGIRIMQADN